MGANYSAPSTVIGFLSWQWNNNVGKTNQHNIVK